MKITFLSSAHKYNDDRLFYHFADSLSKKGHKVSIITGDTDLNKTDEISISSFNGLNYSKEEKIKIYIKKVTYFDPDIIICLEPITIIAAKKYSKNKKTPIVYDITEWYPSKGQLKNHFFILRPIYFLLYYVIFIYSCSLVNGFVYGEYYKGILPRKIFPKKKNIQISYYPKREYFETKKPNIQNNLLRLCYTGTLSIEKGLLNFLDVLKELRSRNKKLHIQVKFIGEFDPNEKDVCLNKINELDKEIQIFYFSFQELTKYTKLINDTDIFLDLRSSDFINSHSLPIKLFYFMALQRPVIYTKSLAITREIEIDEFGHLVNPKDSKKIAEIINKYQKDNQLYITHCTKAKELFESKYNWNILDEKFIDFVENIKS